MPTLRRALREGDVLAARYTLAHLMRLGVVTATGLRALAATAPLPNQSKDLLHSLLEGMVEPPGEVGAVWIALLVEASGAAPSVILRKLVCRVTPRKVSTIALPTLGPWAPALRVLVGHVAPFAAAASDGLAAPDWAHDRVQFDLLRLDGSSAKEDSVYSGDHSFELAAAVALLSAAFRAPVPPGTIALGRIGFPGRILELGRDGRVLEKGSGLLRAVPLGDTVLAARYDEPVLLEALKGAGLTVRVIADSDDIATFLQIRPSDFVGKRPTGLLRAAAHLLLAIATLGLGTPIDVRNAYASPLQRQRLAGRHLGTLLSIAGLATAISLHRALTTSGSSNALAPIVLAGGATSYVALLAALSAIIWLNVARTGRRFQVFFRLREYFRDRVAPSAVPTLPDASDKRWVATYFALHSVLVTIFFPLLGFGLWEIAVYLPIPLSALFPRKEVWTLPPILLTLCGLALWFTLGRALALGLAHHITECGLVDRPVLLEVVPRVIRTGLLVGVFIAVEHSDFGLVVATLFAGATLMSLHGLYTASGLSVGRRRLWLTLFSERSAALVFVLLFMAAGLDRLGLGDQTLADGLAWLRAGAEEAVLAFDAWEMLPTAWLGVGAASRRSTLVVAVLGVVSAIWILSWAGFYWERCATWISYERASDGS